MYHENQDVYTSNDSPFEVRGDSLYMYVSSRHGSGVQKICNFVPCIVQEKTVDDGAAADTRLVLRARHSDGSLLPDVEIGAGELAGFNWLIPKWGAKCNIECGQSQKDRLRYFIQSTAQFAVQCTEYRVTGWKRTPRGWRYLLPGCEGEDVILKGKLDRYRTENTWDEEDLRTAMRLFTDPPGNAAIIRTLTAFTFLSPLNEFLRRAQCEPKFVLFLSGRTGTRKSTLAALFLSFFGSFSAADLPMSFRDTPNSIIANAFTLKDVLTCIDDYYPSENLEMRKLTACAQTVMRAYGDRAGRARLRSDCSLMESRPPQGNAIVTGELHPAVGESGTARYFALTLRDGDVDLGKLTAFQNAAQDGALRRAMHAYTEWIGEKYLQTEDGERELVRRLGERYAYHRGGYLNQARSGHGRLAETVASLMIGCEFFLCFLSDRGLISRDARYTAARDFYNSLLLCTARQTEIIEREKPVNIFIRKLYALIESGEIRLKREGSEGDYSPDYFCGLEDDTYMMLQLEAVHRRIKRLCADQDEPFPFNIQEISKALVEADMADPGNQKVSRVIKIQGRNYRLLFLYKEKAEEVVGLNEPKA